MKSPLAFNHALLKDYIEPGDKVIDATVGNGKDFLFLSKLVGAEGKVTGFDIQPEAIQKTSLYLMENSVAAKAKLFIDGHENMGDYLQENSVQAITFNLGYLPGGDKSITTLAETTLTAIEVGLKLLKKGGLMTLMIYHGHPNGATEKDAVESFVSTLDQNLFTVMKYQPLNQKNAPPFLIAIEKLT